MVATIRALANDGMTSVTDFHDPIAHAWLPGGWREVHRRLLQLPKPVQRHLSRWSDLVPLRTRAIDEVLDNVLEADIHQLVILGAGLDTRAWRLASTKDAVIYEVDHPATQGPKRHLVGRTPQVARRVVYVPLDFTTESLREKFDLLRFKPKEPSVWVWEGVTMYLDDATFVRSLADIAALTSEGSLLLVHYNEPGAPTQSLKPLRWLLSQWREPQIGLRTRHQVADLLAEAGFGVIGDSSAIGWASRFRQPPDVAASLVHTRLAIAQRR